MTVQKHDSIMKRIDVAIDDADLQPRQVKLIAMKLYRIEDVIVAPDN